MFSFGENFKSEIGIVYWPPMETQNSAFWIGFNVPKIYDFNQLHMRNRIQTDQKKPNFEANQSRLKKSERMSTRIWPTHKHCYGIVYRQNSLKIKRLP